MVRFGHDPLLDEEDDPASSEIIAVPSPPPVHPLSRSQEELPPIAISSETLRELIDMRARDHSGQSQHRARTWRNAALAILLSWAFRSYFPFELGEGKVAERCPVLVPSGLESLLLEQVVGQNRSVASMASAVEGWAFEEGRPMGLLLVGPEGVGKSTAALALSRLLFSCQDRRDGLLVLEGADFAQEGEDIGRPFLSWDRKLEFKKRIVEHVRDGGREASVVLVTSVEKMGMGVLDVLLEPLKTMHPVISYEEKSTPINNVLFLLTTTVGTRETYQSIQKFKERNLPKMLLETNLKNALEAHGGFQVGKYVGLVPFLPLTHLHLQEIFIRRARDFSQTYAGLHWTRLQLTKTATQKLVGTDFVEYVHLKNLDSKETFLFFGKHGGRGIDNGAPMQILKSKARRFFFGQGCEKVALFDFQEDKEELVLSWCTQNDHAEGEEFAGGCSEVWRGGLD